MVNPCDCGSFRRSDCRAGAACPALRSPTNGRPIHPAILGGLIIAALAGLGFVLTGCVSPQPTERPVALRLKIIESRLTTLEAKTARQDRDIRELERNAP